MKQRIIKIATVLLLVAIIPVSMLLYGYTMPNYYQNSYYAELAEMYQRLSRTEGRKIILIGGSNVAFGVDTDLLDHILRQYGYDYTICPFGLYAAVGTSAMLELSKDTLKTGDIVVLAIEPTNETMSTYFGATAFWKCTEESPELLTKVNKVQAAALIGNYLDYLQDRYTISQSESTPKAVGVYAKASFNENCNMTYPREGNSMALGYDTSSPVNLADVAISVDFAQQVNEYCEYAANKGAIVYFSFSPVNKSALTDNSNEAIAGYFKLCNETFSCPIISDPNNYILDSGWFYDSNFHLNSSGAVLRTCILAEDILAQLGCFCELIFPRPQMPDSIAQSIENTAYTSYFEFAPVGDNLGYLISGLTEAGLAQESLNIPTAYEGRPVVGFTSDAFSGANILEELRIPESIESLPNYLFRDCNNLTRLVLEHTQSICKISEDTFNSADHIKIFVPEEAYPMYRDGYGCESNPWSELLDRMFVYG